MSLIASSSRALIFAIVAVLGALSTASVASASPQQPASAAGGARPEAMADARFKAGLAAYDKGNYEAARLEFLQAQAIYPRASILRNLALSELHTGRPLEALQHLRTFLADPGTSADKRALGERSLAEAYAQTGHLSITAPDGSHVKVDGKDVGIAPLKDAVDVLVGLHGVDTDSAGAGSHQSVQTGAGKLTEVAFLGPVVAAAPGAGAPAAAAPAAAPVAAPQEPAKSAYWNGRRTVGVVIAGVGVVGMVIGGVFGAARGSEMSDASAALAAAHSANPSVSAGGACINPPSAGVSSCTAVSSALSSYQTDASIEESLLIGGGLLVVVGAVTALWPAGPAGPPMSQLAPITGPHVAGLQWKGTF